MKNRLLQFLALFMAASVLFSCQDEYTEEDALEAQQLIDLAIYVFDQGSVNQDPVAGATVKLVQGSETREVTTDASGSAIFTDAKIGGFIYSVSGANFTTVTNQGSLSTTNFRQGQETFAVGVYLDGTANTAVVKGRIAIETDLTNDVTEYAANIDLLVNVYLDEETKTFSTTTDADGRYEITVPTDVYGYTSVEIRYPDLELDQTLVYSRLSSESGSFPDVLPSVQTYPTLFSMYTGGAQNYNNFPSYAYESVYAIVEEAPETGTTAVVDYVYVNNDGEITGVSFSTYGNYADDADGLVTVTFTSLTGGSGATLTYDVTGTYSNLQYIEWYDQAMRTLDGGSGYSDDYLNKNYYEGPSVSNSTRSQYVYVYPGTTTIQNADYGTGVYREDNLD